jgi:hypothetical protein
LQLAHGQRSARYWGQSFPPENLSFGFDNIAQAYGSPITSFGEQGMAPLAGLTA